MRTCGSTGESSMRPTTSLGIIDRSPRFFVGAPGVLISWVGAR
jgi:hypothetical protein